MAQQLVVVAVVLVVVVVVVLVVVAVMRVSDACQGGSKLRKPWPRPPQLQLYSRLPCLVLLSLAAVRGKDVFS